MKIDGDFELSEINRKPAGAGGAHGHCGQCNDSNKMTALPCETKSYLIVGDQFLFLIEVHGCWDALCAIMNFKNHFTGWLFVVRGAHGLLIFQ